MLYDDPWWRDEEVLEGDGGFSLEGIFYLILLFVVLYCLDKLIKMVKESIEERREREWKQAEPPRCVQESKECERIARDQKELDESIVHFIELIRGREREEEKENEEEDDDDIEMPPPY